MTKVPADDMDGRSTGAGAPGAFLAARRSAVATLASAAVALSLLFGGCGRQPIQEADGPPLGNEPRIVQSPEEVVPRAEPPSRYGNPPTYVVRGTTYRTLDSSEGYVERGIASWYGRKFHGRRTSSGEPYDMFAMTAAHRALPLPTYARVTHLGNRRSIIVRVNDRGPFHPNRVIDLSYAAAQRLGIVGEGTGPVEVTALSPRELARSAPVVASSEQVNIYLQVGAFSTKENAERMVHSVIRLSGDAVAEIQPGVAGGRALYRVRVGPLADVQAADSLSEQLLERGLADAIVVLDGSVAP